MEFEETLSMESSPIVNGTRFTRQIGDSRHCVGIGMPGNEFCVDCLGLCLPHRSVQSFTDVPRRNIAVSQEDPSDFANIGDFTDIDFCERLETIGIVLESECLETNSALIILNYVYHTDWKNRSLIL